MQIILVEARLTGVVARNGANQIQMVLDLTVPLPEMVLVQGMNWIAISSLCSKVRLWHPCHHGTVRHRLRPVPVATKVSHGNRSNAGCFLVALDKRAFCESLVTRLGQESFDATVTINRIRGFDGEAPSQSNNFCCVDATEELSEFRGLVEINSTQYCFIAQINSDDQHRARFIPAQEVLEEPSGQPRKMQPIIQEMILGRKRGVMLIPESEDDAVDVIAGLIEQGFH